MESSASITEPPHVHPRRRMGLLGVRALAWILYGYVVVVEVVLALGFVLLLFGASPTASFVAWVYRSLDRAMEPFRGMFTPIELGLRGDPQPPAVLDTSVLFAMVAYAIAAWLVSELLAWINGFLARLDAADERAWTIASQRGGPAATPPGPAAPRSRTDHP
ncbi:hypothetical protein KUV85_03910 [Nocardioides panacisoli]|uniref:hypothetical protein n=1 Tax=Nocardioides panacisoli TaxID=627624 RepID=UPI001C62FF75|nr:hypothetical protein [Nocardioides panacisoli]QYJ04839.1 hypothetical protein KUV85_03910 [Nocardioides panacisoli]